MTDGEEPNETQYWLPKKFVENWDDADEPLPPADIIVEIPQWLAEEKEMV